jgi:hypothetical protein
MENQDYTCSITAQTTAPEAFENICRVSEWWAIGYEGKSHKLNDVFTVRFGDTWVTFKLTEVIAGKKIAWHVTDCFLHWLNDKTEWKNTDVVFEILEKENATQINFTHVGLAPQVECYDTCIKGWNEYITGSLSNLIATGKGQPN